jgi:hypothetical protein
MIDPNIVPLVERVETRRWFTQKGTMSAYLFGASIGAFLNFRKILK